jgi:hypothetical protein
MWIPSQNERNFEKDIRKKERLSLIAEIAAVAAAQK